MSGVSRPGGTGRPNQARDAKFLGADGDGVKNIFCVRQTKSWIGNLTRLIHTLPRVLTIHTDIHQILDLLSTGVDVPTRDP